MVYVLVHDQMSIYSVLDDALVMDLYMQYSYVVLKSLI